MSGTSACRSRCFPLIWRIRRQGRLEPRLAPHLRVLIAGHLMKLRRYDEAVSELEGLISDYGERAPNDWRGPDPIRRAKELLNTIKTRTERTS